MPKTKSTAVVARKKPKVETLVSLAVSIKASIAEYETSIHGALDARIKIGEGLLRARKLFAKNHGEWGPWLANNFKLSDESARRYMAGAEHKDVLLAAKDPELSLRKAMKMIRASGSTGDGASNEKRKLGNPSASYQTPVRVEIIDCVATETGISIAPSTNEPTFPTTPIALLPAPVDSVPVPAAPLDMTVEEAIESREMEPDHVQFAVACGFISAVEKTVIDAINDRQFDGDGVTQLLSTIDSALRALQSIKDRALKTQQPIPSERVSATVAQAIPKRISIRDFAIPQGTHSQTATKQA